MQVHIDRNGERYGPYSIEDINAYLANGTLLPTDSAWQDGMTDWLPLSQIHGVSLASATQRPAKPTNYFFLDANNKQFGPITLEALFSFQAKGVIHAQSLVLKEGTTQWQPFHTFPEASQAMGLKEAIAPESLLDSVDERSVEIFGSKGSFDSVQDLIASVIGNSTCLGMAPVKTIETRFGTDALKYKWKASGGVIDGERTPFWEKRSFSLPATMLIAIGIWYFDLFGSNADAGKSVEYADAIIGSMVLLITLILLLIGWIKRKLKGIQGLPDISVITQYRFTCITGLIINKKKKKFAYERVVSIPRAQLESKTWDLLICQQLNVFTKSDGVNILGLSSDLRLSLLQSSRLLKKEKAIFGEQVIGVKKAKQILTSR